MQALKNCNRTYCTSKEEIKAHFEQEFKNLRNKVIVNEGRVLAAVYSKISVSSLLLMVKDEPISVEDSIAIIASGEREGMKVIANARTFDMATRVGVPEHISTCSIKNAIDDFVITGSLIGTKAIKSEVTAKHIWVVDYVILHNNMIEGYIEL